MKTITVYDNTVNYSEDEIITEGKKVVIPDTFKIHTTISPNILKTFKERDPDSDQMSYRISHILKHGTHFIRGDMKLAFEEVCILYPTFAAAWAIKERYFDYKANRRRGSPFVPSNPDECIHVLIAEPHNDLTVPFMFCKTYEEAVIKAVECYRDFTLSGTAVAEINNLEEDSGEFYDFQETIYQKWFAVFSEDEFDIRIATVSFNQPFAILDLD